MNKTYVVEERNPFQFADESERHFDVPYDKIFKCPFLESMSKSDGFSHFELSEPNELGLILIYGVFESKNRGESREMRHIVGKVKESQSL